MEKAKKAIDLFHGLYHHVDHGMKAIEAFTEEFGLWWSCVPGAISLVDENVLDERSLTDLTVYEQQYKWYIAGPLRG